jgi:superfamily I DNA/RNA helicase
MLNKSVPGHHIPNNLYDMGVRDEGLKGFVKRSRPLLRAFFLSCRKHPHDLAVSFALRTSHRLGIEIQRDFAVWAVSSEATDMDAVRVMTIHGSKGLEFPAVHLPALETLSNASMEDRPQ